MTEFIHQSIAAIQSLLDWKMLLNPMSKYTHPIPLTSFTLQLILISYLISEKSPLMKDNWFICWGNTFNTQASITSQSIADDATMTRLLWREHVKIDI